MSCLRQLRRLLSAQGRPPRIEQHLKGISMEFTLNGNVVTTNADPGRQLLSVLRADLGLTGTNTVAASACAAPAPCWWTTWHAAPAR